VELGRHAILRGWWGNPWGFESPLRHYDFKISEVLTNTFAKIRELERAPVVALW
jgi:hypothetical protein